MESSGSAAQSMKVLREPIQKMKVENVFRPLRRLDRHYVHIYALPSAVAVPLQNSQRWPGVCFPV